MTVLLLDTNVWSHLILSPQTKQEQVRAQLQALLARYPNAVRATSGICVAECMVAARRLADETQRQAAESSFKAEFAAVDLMVIDVSEAVLDKAATLRAVTLLRAASQGGGAAAGADGGKLKLPDAIVAASCLEFDPPAILVTENDKDFRYVDAGGLQTVAGITVEKLG